MEYVYGALLLHKLGKPINEENLKKVIEAAGAEVNEAKVKVLVASLEGVDVDKELESASLATPSGAGEAKEAGEEKKVEEKKEEKASEAAEGLSSLFG